VKPEARYPAGRPFNLAPGVQGAHGWEANAYSPQTGLMYVPTQHAYFPMINDPKYAPSPLGYNLGIVFGTQFDYYRDHPEAKSGFVAYLQALNPVTGKVVWRGDSTSQGGTGGAVATAGDLVFQSGGDSQEVRAYDARTGQKLWSFPTQTGVNAPPITFALDGRQYVAVSAGGNQREGYYAPNYSRLLVFALDGRAKLPPPKPYTRRPLAPPPATADAALVQAGAERYSHFCAACHGENGQTRGSNFPDLTRTPLLYTQLGFDQVVLRGVLAERGMDSFASILKPSDTEAIRAYIIARANYFKKNPPPEFGVSAPRQPHEGAGQ
jgi:alcohol dehydrogenase (cytochrome c)/quinohemoprotein ethanol dehydrogenase